jgi:hypothetical protein
LSPPDLSYHLGRARDLTTQYQAGGNGAFWPFLELAQFVLLLTIMDRGSGLIMQKGPRSGINNVVGRTGGDRIRLNDGRWLRILMQLYLDPAADNRLKVSKSLFQYQVDEEAEQWAFRYDYIRDQKDDHPSAHIQIRGALTETEIVPVRGTLERVHFPTGRVGLEAVIRLLVEQYGISTNEEPDVWRPVLAETESAFLKIAHLPISGPSN